MNTPTIDTLKETTVLVMDSKCPEDVFGVLVGDQMLALSQIFKSLTLKCHPDLFKDNTLLAKSTFQELGRWKSDAEKKIEAGTYGDNKPYIAPKPYTPVKFSIGKQEFTCVSSMGRGSLSTLHEVASKVPWKQWVLKITINPSNNDLLDREFKVLTDLHTTDKHEGREKFYTIQRNYIPEPLDSFMIAGKESRKHRANLLSTIKARTFTAQQLIEEKFPGGIETKHLYWIFRRTLMTLWMAHLKGYVYGNLTPDHLLIYPKEHGLVLLDWTAATRIGSKVPVVSKKWEDFYPQEILKGGPATPSSDLYMAAKMALYLSQDIDLPSSVRALLMECLGDKGRPSDAEKLHERFGQVIEAAHGPRVYAEFDVP